MNKILNDTKSESERFISGGYRLVKYVKRPDYLGKDLLPENILTTSTCITGTLPDSWAITWIREENIKREEKASEFGIGKERLEKITDWVTSQVDEGKIGIPNAFYSTDDAKHFLSKFNLSLGNLVLLGIGIHENLAKAFIESTKVQNIMDGLILSVEQGNKLESAGIPLGYEIYGHETGSYHSWLCNSLEKEAFDKFNIRPNMYGLLDNYADAVKCAEFFEQPEVGAEEVPWFPWKIVKYKL